MHERHIEKYDEREIDRHIGEKKQRRKDERRSFHLFFLILTKIPYSQDSIRSD